MSLDPCSVLFLVLDSCRYDTFLGADAPNMRRVGPVHRAQAPSHFTYGSHAAMFVGFTPGLFHLRAPLLNPKYGKLFKLVGAGFPGRGGEAFVLHGGSIIEAFRSLGFATLGTGAVGWFDPATPTGRRLSGDFEQFFYPGGSWRLDRQLAWLDERLAASGGEPVFAFLNIGETHVPYYFAGAPWDPTDNPCVPFQTVDRAHECRRRQRACVAYVDTRIGRLLDRFAHATILICADHGDCWGEDGLWEHGVSHEMTLTVPLILRHRGAPV